MTTGVWNNGTGTVHSHGVREEGINNKNKYVTHKHTLSSHKNASLGISSTPVLGSTGLCDSCNILDRVTFFTPEC
jgi:hypothetical protein